MYLYNRERGDFFVDIPTPDIITIVGLLLDAIGIILLFCVAPEKFPDPHTGIAMSSPESRKAKEEWKKMQVKRNRRANFSLGMIVTGFLLQAFAVYYW